MSVRNLTQFVTDHTGEHVVPAESVLAVIEQSLVQTGTFLGDKRALVNPESILFKSPRME
jgi:hypothetical protein